MNTSSEAVPQGALLDRDSEKNTTEGLTEHQREVASPDRSVEAGEDVVTWKTWLVVLFLAMGYGAAYFPVIPASVIQAQIAGQLGAASQSAWMASGFFITGVVAMMICAPNSDLFGRRWFLIAGNVMAAVGSVIAGTAQSFQQLLAGMAIAGFGSGIGQMVAFAGPELLPNKWRPTAVVIADSFCLIASVIGPVVGRAAIRNNSTTGWPWLFYGSTIVNGFVAVALYFTYFPPKHPRGLSFRQALKELDYVGALLFIISSVLILVGVVYASYLQSSDARVVGPLVSGFAVLIGFACWETWAPLKQPLTPTALFVHNRGQTLTAPFIVTLMVTVYYLGGTIVWNTIINVVFVTPESSESYIYGITVAQGLSIVGGAVLLSSLGSYLKHWKWTMFGCVTLMTMFGGLMALVSTERRKLLMALNVLLSMSYGWSQFLSIAYCQFGAPQMEIGIAGGLAGVARIGGNALASSVYITIFRTSVSNSAQKDVVAAVVAAGGSQATGEAVLAAIPLGSQAVMAISGVTARMATAAGLAYQHSNIIGIRTLALASIAFGAVGMIACLWCEDITPKMTPKIEVFLENDIQADKNRYH